MTYWDLRKYLESKTPWWMPFAFISSYFLFIYICSKLNAKRELKKMEKRLKDQKINE